MKQQVMVVPVWILVLLLSIATAADVLRPGCREKCGDLAIPYPFGIDDGCYLQGFKINCSNTFSPPKAFIPGTYIQVANISLTSAYVRGLYNRTGWDCYNETDKINYNEMSINISATPAFLFSDTNNMFTAIGCETLAYIWSEKGNNSYGSGCVAMCYSPDSAVNGSCSGIGCCQTSIRKNLDYYQVQWGGFNHSRVWNYSPCSYAMLVEKNWYNFSTLDLPGIDFWNNKVAKGYPIMLDWAVRNASSCKEAEGRPGYACISSNTICHDSTNGPGYFCNCAPGYGGNPYLVDGCQDINECEIEEQGTCFGECRNLPGSYNCTCWEGTKGNATVKGGCRKDDNMAFVKPVVGSCAGVVLLAVICFLAYVGFEKKKLIRTKRKFFEQNGGLLLQQEIYSQKCTTFKIYSTEELKKATNNFDKNSIIGRGGHGIVYKGVLEGKETVAVKKSRIMDESQLKEYTKETFILSQINHRNIVKLLGCCLEVEVPMLVYEFVSNGTLFHYLHGMNGCPMHLDMRLKIAAESAAALAYLHSWASPPILHGDVKSSNILLDDEFTAKVSDFGASKLAPMDETQLATLVQGTCGYLDPEYMQTCQLTDKSDVYSFAVVLLELITGKRALYFEGSEQERSLVACFISAMREGKFLEILDDLVKHEGGEDLFQEIGMLIDQCLSFKGVERPTMKEVAEVLERLRKYDQSLLVQHNSEEIEFLLGEPSSFPADDTTTYGTMEHGAMKNIRAGR